MIEANIDSYDSIKSADSFNMSKSIKSKKGPRYVNKKSPTRRDIYREMRSQGLNRKEAKYLSSRFPDSCAETSTNGESIRSDEGPTCSEKRVERPSRRKARKEAKRKRRDARMAGLNVKTHRLSESQSGSAQTHQLSSSKPDTHTKKRRRSDESTIDGKHVRLKRSRSQACSIGTQSAAGTTRVEETTNTDQAHFLTPMIQPA